MSRLKLIPAWLIALLLCAFYLLIIKMANPTLGISAFIQTGTKYSEGDPQGTDGYDGQFTLYIAANPVHIENYLDVPAYRYQRILHPLLSRWLAFGNISAIPATMLLIDIVALAVGTAAMEQLLKALGINRWYALVYGLFGGIFFAVRVSTTEPLAYGLVMLALVAGQRNGYFLQAILLALAAFAKETTLFFVAGYLAYFLLERRWRQLIQLAIITIIPFVLWQFYLYTRFGSFGVGAGGALATSFEIFPFNGIWRLFGFDWRVILSLLIIIIPIALIPTLWALWRSGRDILKKRWHPYVFLLAANAIIMPFVPFSTYREPLALFRFLDGLMISVLLYAALRRERRVLTYTTLWNIFSLRLLG